MKNWKTILAADLTALLLGVFLTFSFAPYEIFPLAFLTPLGLLALWQKTTPRGAWWKGFMFGIGYYGVGVYWVYISIHTIGGVPSGLAYLITGALIVYMALFPAFTGYLTNRYFPTNNVYKFALAFPAIWVCSEWVRSWLLSGFPWLLLGYSQTNSPLKGFAPLLSVYAVSLACTITSGLLLNAYLKFKQKDYGALYLSLFIVFNIWIAGALFDLIPWTKPQDKPLSVAMVQGNVPQAIKWSPEHLQLSLDRYEGLTKPLWGKTKIIIWPESAIPLAWHEAQSYVQSMYEKAIASNATLLMGIPILAKDGNGYYNAVVALGSQPQLYVKRHLVPYGEYTPMAQLLVPLLKFFDIPTSDLIPGNMNQAVIEVDGVKFLMSICYEIAFPELINSTDKTIGLLLTVTNDAWFGKSAAQAQHLQMAKMRAIEMRRPALMVSNDGITAVIGTKGEIEAYAKPYEIEVLQTLIHPVQGLTPWMTNGMEPMLVILLVLLLIAIRKERRAALAFTQSKKTLVSDEK